MSKLAQSYYEDETARLLEEHRAAITAARRLNAARLQCVRGTACPGHQPETVAILLTVCARARADLAWLKSIGF